MSDYSNPYSGSTGNEPTMPLAPSSGYGQPAVPPVEPTVVDPFNSSGAASSYPDFSYDTPSGYSGSTDYSAGSRDSLGINPDPLPASPNYAQPYAPPMDAYPEPDPEPLTPVVQQYQQYPVAAPAPPAPVYAAPQPYGFAPLPEHPSSIPALVLGLVGIFLWIPFASPIAWYLSARGRRDMANNPGKWRSSGMLTAGFVLGIIGTLIGVLVFGLIVLGIIVD